MIQLSIFFYGNYSRKQDDLYLELKVNSIRDPLGFTQENENYYNATDSMRSIWQKL